MENRYSILRLMSIGAALMTASWLQAQDVLVTLEAEKGIMTPVSYTHLTLPTTERV